MLPAISHVAAVNRAVDRTDLETKLNAGMEKKGCIKATTENSFISLVSGKLTVVDNLPRDVKFLVVAQGVR